MQSSNIHDYFPSSSTMMSVDLLLIFLSGIATIVVIGKWTALRKADAALGVVLILAGIWTGVLLYVSDLFTMTILPRIVGPAEAMAAMRALHIGYSWYINSASAVLIVAGLGLTVMQLIRQMEAVETNSRAHEESEDLLESIFQNVPVGLLIKDSDNVVERPNNTYLNWYGLSSAEVVGHRFHVIENFQSSQDIGMMKDQERQVLKTGKTQTRQAERQFADGQRHTVSITKFPVYDKHGRITKVGSVSIDLTEQVEAKQWAEEARRNLHEANEDLEIRVAERTAELQTSEERFRQFAEASSDWFWEQDENLRFTYLSSEVRPKSGLAAAALIGKTRREVVHRGVTEEQWRQHQADLDARRPFRDFTFEKIDQDGIVQHTSVSGIPTFDANGDFLGYRGTATNVTERKRMEVDLVAARQEAEAASRAKSEFLASMSHELRTPLNAIIGYAELLQEEAGDRDDEVLLDDLTKVRNAGRHLLGMISNVLDLSKVEAGKMELFFEEIELDELLSDVADTVQPLVGDNGNIFEASNAATEPAFITDVQKIRQALLNLIGNAAKFTKDGVVRLEVSEEPAGWLNFTVSDTGVGIDADQMSKILEPFTQADAKIAKYYGGTGLGLAITKRFAELLGGRLDAESAPGQGSRFTISLPTHHAATVDATELIA